MLYESDHVGHHYKAKAQWQVPMLFFSSDNNLLERAKRLKDSPYSLDLVDHMLLGLLEIEGEYYQKEFDLLRRPLQGDK